MEKIDLTKCNNCRFKAKIDGIVTTGIVSAKDGLNAFLKNEQGYNVGCLTGAGLVDSDNRPITDFEIAPRDPETYQDWQVGDVICGHYGNNEIIFRSGEVVVFKYANDQASNIFTCRELFKRGYRLVRTDAEEMIWRKQNWEKFHPSDGDIIYLNLEDGGREIIVFESLDEDVIKWYVSVNIDNGGMQTGGSENLRNVKSYRYADSDDKEYFFEKLKENGKRWNAETKVVEDIKPEEDKAADVQKMISDALTGYIPKGDIEDFPVEVIAKMLEQQYEQSGVVDVSVFENDKIAFACQLGFDWDKTIEGNDFWEGVIMNRDFSAFFKKYPKAEAPGAGMPFSFKRFDPVLVRDKDDDIWSPRMFLKNEDNKFYVLSLTGDCVYYNQCIPLNEDTERLINTTDKYYEQ